jgi:hypothetical protein
MASRLNKKYFGNRNVGTTGPDDDGIGGQGLAAYTLPGQLGSLIINNTYSQPQLVIPAPTLPTGVQATATVVWEVESITPSNGLAGDGYVTTTGGATTLTGLAGVTANITAVGSGQGEVQVIVPVNRGSFTTVPTVASTYQIVGGDGEQQATVKFRVKSITTVEKGSGYTTAPTLSWTTAGTNTAGTAVGVPTVALTTDTGNVGSSTNQENAIIAYAYIGGSRKIVDIVGQKGARRYKVTDGTNTEVCNLVTDGAANAVGEMDITVTDSAGGEYWVKKLNNRRCTVVRKASGGGTQFATDSSVSWTLGSAVLNTSVKISNA